MCAKLNVSDEEMVEKSGSSAIFASLEAMGLIAKGGTPELTMLTGGVSADIVAVQTKVGLVCVKRTLPELKVAQQWRAPQSRGNAEKEWIRLVAKFLPQSVPEIIGEDAERFTFAMRYLDPVYFKNWKSLLRGGMADIQMAVAVARLLGKIHEHTAHSKIIATQFANDDNFNALRLDPYLETAAQVNPDVADLLRSLIRRTATTKEALVHGDFSPKNILIGPDGPVILDAECAWYGDPAFDVAFCLNHLMLKLAWMPIYASQYIFFAEEFWQAYCSELHSLDKIAIEMRVSTLIPGLMLARIDGKSTVEYITDSETKKLIRNFSKRNLIETEQTLLGLIQSWHKEIIK